MKKIIPCISLLLCMQLSSIAQAPDRVERAVQNVERTINKGKSIIDVFQPYLLKAREIYGQAKQLVKDVKKTKVGNTANAEQDYGNSGTAPASEYPAPSSTPPAASYPSSAPESAPAAAPAPSGTYGAYENYTPQQYLPIDNPAIVNSDGTGNWGNQNNGLYGNCLDVMTGTVVGMGEAEDKPDAVDLMFFAPSDGQNTYVLMTPSFARNNSTATYLTQHASDGVTKWKDVTESEVALTRLTLAQFDRIQNNNQIAGAVKNAVNYAGYYSSVGTKLEGQVFAVKVEQENRTVYALVAIVRHFGTSGSNGYLKIKVKSQGIDNNRDGVVDPSAYIR